MRTMMGVKCLRNHYNLCMCVSGAGQASVSVRLPSLSMWMVTGAPGASGACAAGPVVQESSSDRGNVTTHRMSPVFVSVCVIKRYVREYDLHTCIFQQLPSN